MKRFQFADGAVFETDELFPNTEFWDAVRQKLKECSGQERKEPEPLAPGTRVLHMPSGEIGVVEGPASVPGTTAVWWPGAPRPTGVRTIDLVPEPRRRQ